MVMNECKQVDRKATDTEKIRYGNRFYEIYRVVDKYKISEIPYIIKSFNNSILGLHDAYIDACNKYEWKALDISLSYPLMEISTITDTKIEQYMIHMFQ